MESQKLPELTLSALLTQRCVEFSNSPAAVEIIDKGVEKLFTNIVDSAFSSYGDFGKLMGEAMKKALPSGVENIVELERYNALIVRLIREKWATAGIENSIVEQMTALVNEFTSEEAIPAYIMASDFWKAFIEDQSEHALEEQWGCPQVHVDRDSSFGSLVVGLHPEPASSSRYSSSTKDHAYNCDFYFHLSPKQDRDGRERVNTLHDGHQAYQLIGGQVDNGILGKRIIKPYSRFDKLVMALYYGSGVLVWDEEPDDLYYPSYDD